MRAFAFSQEEPASGLRSYASNRISMIFFSCSVNSPSSSHSAPSSSSSFARISRRSSGLSFGNASRISVLTMPEKILRWRVRGKQVAKAKQSRGVIDLRSALPRIERVRTRRTERRLPVPTWEDLWVVAPALARYTEGRLLGDLWKRPDLSPRDRSNCHRVSLIARNQTIEMPYHFNPALDKGSVADGCKCLFRIYLTFHVRGVSR
jgi:hypothetical protein